MSVRIIAIIIIIITISCSGSGGCSSSSSSGSSIVYSFFPCETTILIIADFLFIP
jgi:hypothetical protein